MSWAVWVTGLPDDAVAAVGRAAAQALEADGEHVALLEVAEFRRLLAPSSSGSDAEDELVHRALVYVASSLTEAGVPVVIAAPGHRRAWRDLARAVIPRFAEVQLAMPPAASEAASYEPSAAPELVIDPAREGVEDSARRIVDTVAGWRGSSPRARRPRWAVWITGLPGSGKTTIASRVAEALGRRGHAVRVLDLVDVRAFITGAWSPLAEDIAHRALVYAAQRLTDAGVAVIIDATAPARAWRTLARERIARFAEVQLVCPAEICADRERAVRWRLLGCAHGHAPRHAADLPDIVLAYEPAVAPDATIYTDVEDPWSAAEAVLQLTARLAAIADATAA